ncbi:MAG TPA: sulfotransferase, partial [Acetobacteraceae bacterium]|nr:sulfotransferase [Acetobacteraceae bacterium]
MRQALAADPTNNAADANLAGFLLLGGDTDGALARLRAVLARDPGCVPARLNLANALALEQEAAAALDLLQGPVPPGREGRHWRAHRASALIGLRRWEEARVELDAIPEPWGDAEILILWRRIALAAHGGDSGTTTALVSRMETAVRAEHFLPEHRIIGNFGLARLHNRAGRTEQAFAHWTAGHRLLGRFQSYDREQVRAFTDASIAAFDAARLAGSHASNNDPAPVFVVGMPRSGTTLAEQILAAHPAVHGAGERPDVHRCAERLGGPVIRSESVCRLAALGDDALTQAADRFLRELHALAPEAERIVDKMPGNARHLGFLALLLPGARFIHCRRDPRDIGLSIFQLRFFGYHPYAQNLGDLGFEIGQHERLMAHWRAVLGPRLIEVELTGWTDDFDSALARVLDFVGLPHDPACARFYEQKRHVRTASAMQVHQPINRRGVGRFRAYTAYLEPLFAELDRAGLVTWSAEDARARAAALHDRAGRNDEEANSTRR